MSIYLIALKHSPYCSYERHLGQFLRGRTRQTARLLQNTAYILIIVDMQQGFKRIVILNQ